MLSKIALGPTEGTGVKDTSGIGVCPASLFFDGLPKSVLAFGINPLKEPAVNVIFKSKISGCVHFFK